MSDRRLKFRVWDNEASQWYQPTYRVYAGELHDLMLNLDGSLSLRTPDGLTHESLFPGRYELFQYTGFKDMNGREIFEGDIILHHDCDPPAQGTVEWLAKQGEWSPGMGLMSEAEDWLQVVGNVKQGNTMIGI